MSQVNYDVMSDIELKQYFLQNRQDKAALEAYLDRLSQKPQTIIARPGDPDFDEKIQSAIRERLSAAKGIQPVNHTSEASE
jgi:predicted metal-dependent RNase